MSRQGLQRLDRNMMPDRHERQALHFAWKNLRRGLKPEVHVHRSPGSMSAWVVTVAITRAGQIVKGDTAGWW